MSNVVLHQWQVSPFCTKVRKILERKRIAYSTVDYNGLRALKAAKLTGVGKLPVLDYNGRRIQDSSEIAAFLEEAHPEPPLFPPAGPDRAMARIWEDWADESLYWFEVYFRFMDPVALRSVLELLCAGRPAYERIPFSLVSKQKIGAHLKAQGIARMPRDRVERKFFGHMEDLDLLLQTRDWLVGDRQSIADISVSAQLEEILRTSPLRDRILGYANLRAWLARQE